MHIHNSPWLTNPRSLSHCCRPWPWGPAHTSPGHPAQAGSLHCPRAEPRALQPCPEGTPAAPRLRPLPCSTRCLSRTAPRNALVPCLKQSTSDKLDPVPLGLDAFRENLNSVPHLGPRGHRCNAARPEKLGELKHSSHDAVIPSSITRIRNSFLPSVLCLLT